MLFSSSVFLFAYLPIVLVVYYIPLRGLRRAQNLFLLAASLLFYAWGEPWFVLVMAASIAANYGFGLWVHPNQPGPAGSFGPRSGHWPAHRHLFFYLPGHELRL